MMNKIIIWKRLNKILRIQKNLLMEYIESYKIYINFSKN